MRKALVLLVLLFVSAANAETIGDVIVEPRAGVAPVRDGTYFEFRFSVLNPTAEAKRVRITVQGRSYAADVVPGATREVVVAPRATALVSIPQFVVMDYSPKEALVDVQGEQGTINLGGFASASYRTQRDILVGRTVPPEIVAAFLPNEESGTEVRAVIAPASWSSNWLHYSPFTGMILTTADWREMPRPVQGALLRWVAAGGSLTFVGEAEGLPPLRDAAMTDLSAGYHGFGTISLIPNEVPPAETINNVYTTWDSVDLENRYALWAQNPGDTAPVKLLEDKALPVKSIFSLLIVFAIVGGPVNLWVLAKKQRRLWIFWTLPILGLVTAFIVVGAVIFSEGWVRIQRTVSLTLLDERIGEASTLGWTGMYSTLPPDGEIRFDSGTEVRPMFPTPDANTDWTDGQRFASGWVGSRVETGFTVRKVEPRRERLPLRVEGGQLVAINGLGAELKELWIADENGNVYKANNVAAGKELVVPRIEAKLDPNVKDPANLYGPPGTWPMYYSRVSAAPLSVLRPGMYVAVMQRSPFVEAALAKPTRSTQEGVVIGVTKGIDHAS